MFDITFWQSHGRQIPLPLIGRLVGDIQGAQKHDWVILLSWYDHENCIGQGRLIESNRRAQIDVLDIDFDLYYDPLDMSMLNIRQDVDYQQLVVEERVGNMNVYRFVDKVATYLKDDICTAVLPLATSWGGNFGIWEMDIPHQLNVPVDHPVRFVFEICDAGHRHNLPYGLFPEIGPLNQVDLARLAVAVEWQDDSGYQRGYLQKELSLSSPKRLYDECVRILHGMERVAWDARERGLAPVSVVNRPAEYPINSRRRQQEERPFFLDFITAEQTERRLRANGVVNIGDEDRPETAVCDFCQLHAIKSGAPTVCHRNDNAPCGPCWGLNRPCTFSESRSLFADDRLALLVYGIPKRTDLVVNLTNYYLDAERKHVFRRETSGRLAAAGPSWNESGAIV